MGGAPVFGLTDLNRFSTRSVTVMATARSVTGGNLTLPIFGRWPIYFIKWARRLHSPHVALSSVCKTQREGERGDKQGAGRCDRSFAGAEPYGGHDYGALGDPSALSLTPRCLVALFLAPSSSSSSSAHSFIHFPVTPPLQVTVWPMLSQCFIRPRRRLASVLITRFPTAR